MNIDKSVAIVTGGASGLGAAVAQHLAERGAIVCVLDRNGELAAEWAGKIGGHAYTGDVSSSEQMSATVKEITTTHGAPRILVNCAGIGGAARVVGREGPMALADFERTISVNLVGTFNMIRLVGATMSLADPFDEGARGVIVSTASLAAFDGQIGQAAYAASKGGIAAMTLPIAREFARFGIRVMTLAPGLFKTPLLDELPQEAQDALGAAIPYPSRLGYPSEFAELVETCITNNYLNGEIIRIDGSLRLGPK